MKHPRQSGVALVITLIMLSVITVMAVAFLALSRRERASVVHSQATIDAEQAANTGLERAKAEILARIIAQVVTSNIPTNITVPTNLFGPELFVSGSTTNIPPAPLIYDDPVNGPNQAAARQWIWSLANGSRPPVFVKTNAAGTPRENRFFLDLNRNGVFDTNGLLPVLDANGNTMPDTNSQSQIQMGVFTGDPEWLGVLSRPQGLHTNSNRFIERYAYIVLPVGHSLDLNFIHNDAVGTIGQSTSADGYRRNEGVGSWEINLAAFLVDLNSGPLGYGGPGSYTYNPSGGSIGTAFEDAKSFLSLRYAGSWRSLASAAQMLDPNAMNPGTPINFMNDGIDAYLRAPMTPLGGPVLIDADTRPTESWSGADSTNHFFSVHDVFRGRGQTFNMSPFTNRLMAASQGIGSDDRYTYYRMFGQMGTDSAAESPGKLNLNFKNVGGLSATNYVPWTNAVEFFTNAVIRLISDEFQTNATAINILVATNGNPHYYVTNLLLRTNIARPFYNARMHQLLQIAANIYDAARTPTNGETYPYRPSVFRPILEQRNDATNGNNIYIVNFENIFDYERKLDGTFRNALFQGQVPWRELESVGPNETDLSRDNFYGVPYVIGAKKGFPNFNEFAVGSQVEVTRKLEVHKPSPGARPDQTNQMFIVGVSNVFGIEGWNPYKQMQAFPRRLEVFCDNVMSTVLTNDSGAVWTNIIAVNNTTNPFLSRVFDPASNPWRGGDADDGGIRVPLIVGQFALPDSVYTNAPPFFRPISYADAFERNNASYTNKWGLTVKNRVRYFLFDEGRLVDAVSMNDLATSFDVSGELNKNAPLFLTGSLLDDVWDITPQNGTTRGVINQLEISQGRGGVSQGDWGSYGALNSPAGNDRQKSIDKFLAFLGQNAIYGTPDNVLSSVNDSNKMQAPFTPTKRIYQTVTWEVNDPLVHYTTEDLQTVDAYGIPTNIVTVGHLKLSEPVSVTTNGTSIARMNDRYKPWGGNPNKLQDPQDPNADPSAYDVAIKDAGIWNPDNWSFPTNKFPSIGWLGRVHRGTPWQTIYLKAGVAPRQSWLMPNGPSTSMDAHPTNDWRILDLFTTALHPNATRGQLSVNQTNLAAWSAVLSGVAATKIKAQVRTADPERKDHFIEPAANDPAVIQIFEGISRTRENQRFKRFEHVGDILAVPELTTASPFLKTPYTDPGDNPIQYFIRDVDIERIPDQILSLLKLGEPRYVIYAFGQSLKPEYVDPTTGVALNYQVTGELATRTVVHVDFDTIPVSNPPNPYRDGKPDITRPHVVVEQFNILPPE